jgi:hypothetical protein
VDNIEIELREIGLRVVDWIHVTQDRDVTGSNEHGNELSGSVRCWEILE